MWDRTSLHDPDEIARIQGHAKIGAGIVDLGAILYNPVIFTKPEQITIGKGSRIDAFVKIEGGNGVVIGEGVHVASFCHINVGGGQTIIEDGAGLATGAKIVSGGNMPDARGHSAVGPVEDQVFDRSMTTRMKKGSILFANSVLCAGVTIGESSVLAAGSVAHKDIPDGEIWGGVPAKFIRKVVFP